MSPISKYNDDHYFMFRTDQTHDIAGFLISLGFTGANYSEDGMFVVCGRGNSESCPECLLTEGPSWVTEEMAPNLPCLSNQEAELICQTKVSIKGASDGWIYAPGELP